MHAQKEMSTLCLATTNDSLLSLHTDIRVMSVFVSIPQRESEWVYFSKCQTDTLNPTEKKKKTLLQLGMLTRAICLSGQSPACCNSEWIYHLHVNRAAEVVGFLPAAWSLTIWQLSRSKMQPMFGININRQKCPPPTSRFQLESQSFLVKWNQSFHISVHLMFTFIQL